MTASEHVIDGRFHLRRRLGEGTWGRLFVAEDKPIYGALAGGLGGEPMGSTGAVVVVDVVRPSNPSQGVAIQREMQRFVGLRDSGLIDCVACGRIASGRLAGRLYLAMELWKESLEDRLQSQRAISDEELELVASAIAQALAQLHDHKIQHTGVHPHRIVLVGDKWKLVPCGPSAAIGPKIVSPEKTTGLAGDVYAFGITLLQGFLAARGDSVSLDTLASDPGRWLSRLTEQWRSLLGRCLQRDPSRRCNPQQFNLAATPPRHPVTEIRWE